MGKQLRILVVASELPHPAVDGQKLRIYNLLKYLPNACRFDLITIGENNSPLRLDELRSLMGESCESLEFVSKNTVEPFRLSSPFARVRNIFFPHAMSAGVPLFSSIMAQRVKARIASGRYDIIYLCGLYSSIYFDKRTCNFPCVVDICDCLSLLHRTFLQQERRPLLKLKRYLDYVWANRYEKIHGSAFKNIIMISSVDAEKIGRNCPLSRIWVVPNGVDKNHFKRSRVRENSINELLFTGVMDYLPNNEAMLYFIGKIFPIVKEKRPETMLTVAGRNPSAELRCLADKTPGVRVTGFVVDLRPYFEAATVYVSPLISGAGMKNKVLEAWSMGVPVVATSVSCSGIVVRENDNILVADGEDEFAKKTLTALDDEKLRERLSKAGRETVELEYSWKQRSEKLFSIFNEVINQRP